MTPQLQIHHGAPADIDRRQPREQRVYRLLDSLAIPYLRLDHAPAATMEVCAGIDRAFHRHHLGELGAEPCSGPLICKNLFLTNKQHSRHFLLMMPGDKKFLTRLLSAQIQSARLSFASDEELLEMLDTEPGAVSVMGLINDTADRVELLIDRDVLRGSQVGCHPCVNTSSLCLATSHLLDTLLPAIGHTPTIVDLPADA